LRLAKLLAYAEGGNLAFGGVSPGFDLSNALGFGMNYGELLKMLHETSKGDIRKAYRHMKLGIMGGGLLPTTWGPTFDSVLKWSDAVRRGKGTDAALKAVMPIQFEKISKMLEAMKEGRPGKYPMFDSAGGRMYELTGPQLAVETFGPRVAVGSREYEAGRAFKEAGKEYDQIREEIVSLLMEGEGKKAEKLMSKYNIEPSDEALQTAFFRRFVPAKTRREMVTGARGDYQRMEQ